MLLGSGFSPSSSNCARTSSTWSLVSGSYLQWKEGGLAPQVVFEVLSPGNRKGNLKKRFRFFERFGVEEYYSFDPDRMVLLGWLRDGDELRPIPDMQGWTSPRLQVGFELADDLVLHGPDGSPFATYVELAKREENSQLENEKNRQRADRLAAQLRALGVTPEE